MNDLKTKVDDSDAHKLKSVLVELKKLSNVTDGEVAKNTKFITLNTKVNSSEMKI